MKDLENLNRKLNGARDPRSNILGFFALTIFVLAILRFEGIVGMLLYLGFDDVVHADSALFKSLDLNSGEGLDKLPVIDKFVCGIGVLCARVCKRGRL